MVIGSLAVGSFEGKIWHKMKFYSLDKRNEALQHKFMIRVHGGYLVTDDIAEYYEHLGKDVKQDENIHR